jgi:DNA-binding Xre family transcriptional regulator
MTKLYKILINRGLTQTELCEKILKETGVNIELYRMSKIVNGQTKNYFTDTAKAIAKTLQVHIEDILE